MRPLEIMMLHHLPDDMQTPPSTSADNPYHGRASTDGGKTTNSRKLEFWGHAYLCLVQDALCYVGLDKLIHALAGLAA
ncbi:hypothetical protein V6N13_090566 [Hibiscus sabdariffa]